MKKKPEEDTKDVPIVSYYHPNLTLGLVSDSAALPISQLPPVLSQRASASVDNIWLMGDSLLMRAPG
jgi:hypothetical protein